MRAPKKTELIELRISQEDKDAFQQQCREDGIAGSEVIRQLIDRHLQSRSKPKLNRTDWSKTMKTLITRRPLSLGVATLGMLFTSLAMSANLAAADPAQAFNAIDIDNNGEISLEEYAQAQAPFARLTLDDGGSLLRLMSATEAEYAMRRNFDAYDHDQDGVVQTREFTPRYDVVTRISFTLMDVNADGELTHAEMESLGDRSPELAGEVETAFTALDGDRNGVVTLLEYRFVQV
ncbi:MAG: EF-hand domain-containing protein [Pseudomonadota bacterium]